MRGRISISPLLFLSVIGFFLIQGCGHQDDKSAILELVQNGAELAEKHDIMGLFKMTTDHFLAMPGELDRRSCKGVLWRAFQYYGDMSIVYPSPVIDVKADGKTASVWVPFLILKRGHSFPGLNELPGNPKQWLEKVGKAADLYRLKMELVKQGEEWLVKKAHLGRFTGLGFEE